VGRSRHGEPGTVAALLPLTERPLAGASALVEAGKQGSGTGSCPPAGWCRPSTAPQLGNPRACS
jgi:hypothetical protein